MNTKTILRYAAVLVALGFTMTACGTPSERFPGLDDGGDSGDMEDAGDEDMDDDDDQDAGTGGGDDAGDDDAGADDTGADDTGEDDAGADDTGDENEGVCGDGFVDANQGEECDDGNADNLDGCMSDCRQGPTDLYIDYTAEKTELPFAGWGGVGPFAQECPTGQVIIGLTGEGNHNDTYGGINNLQFHCGTPALRDEGAGAELFIDPGESLPREGDLVGPISYEAHCPENHFVIGFDGFQSGFLGGVRLQCAPLAVDGLALSPGATTFAGPLGAHAGPDTFNAYCPPGQVVTGNRGNHGNIVESLALDCRPLVLSQ